MNRTASILLLLCTGIGCGAQTLREDLERAGIPQASFSRAELAQTVNATSASNGDLKYSVYMRVGADQLLSGSPEIVRFDTKSGAVLHKELNAQGNAECCGSPLELQFTRSYVLASFHDNPSANTVLVIDDKLRLIELLYGFDMHEIAPDVVVFTQDMVHFAPAHQARMRVVDLRAGTSQEVYPPKGDPLREAFAKLNQQHMPPAADCEAANDPCDANVYDETLEFRPGKLPGRFEIGVVREEDHAWVNKGAVVEHPFARATYTYQLTRTGWLYCAHELSAARLVSSVAENMPAEEPESCEPHLPVVADMAGSDSPFPGLVLVVK